jgi:hypothetical protein
MGNGQNYADAFYSIILYFFGTLQSERLLCMKLEADNWRRLNAIARSSAERSG